MAQSSFHVTFHWPARASWQQVVSGHLRTWQLASTKPCPRNTDPNTQALSEFTVVNTSPWTTTWPTSRSAGSEVTMGATETGACHGLWLFHPCSLVSRSIPLESISPNSSFRELLLFLESCCFSLFSSQVVSGSLQPHGLGHNRLPCPSPSPRICPSSCPLNWQCHPTGESWILAIIIREPNSAQTLQTVH